MAGRKKIKIPTLREIQKKFPSQYIAGEVDESKRPWLPTRFLAFNKVTGGGCPFGKIIELFGEESSGKQGANYEPILTTNGWKTHGTITTDDLVVDPVTGKGVKVLGVFPQGCQDIYRVTFKNGAHFDCGPEHLWEVYFRSHGEDKMKVVTTLDLLKNYRKERSSGKGKYEYKYHIICTQPVEFGEKSLPINPYVLGFILGDGCITSKNVTSVRFTVSSIDFDEVHKRLTYLLDPSRGEYIKLGTRTETVQKFRLYGFKDRLIELGLWGTKSGTKFIPVSYLYGSITQRKELLSGILDTDGSVSLMKDGKTKTSVMYSTHSTMLSEGVYHLVGSLGGICFNSTSNRGEYKLHFRLPFNPFERNYRKKALDYQLNKSKNVCKIQNTITDIKYIGKEECTCIKVDTDRGLYITRDWVVTHNTMMAYDFAYCCQYLGGMVLWVDAEQSFTNDWAKKNGLDLNKIVVYRSTSIEAISDWVANMALYWRSQLTHNEPILLVLDSVSALDTDINLNSEMLNASADMGNRAKAIYKYFRIRNEMLYSLGITQVYINQLRKNLKAGMFENPDCLHYNVKIPFVDGTSMKIGDIVKYHVNKEVWSYNEETKEFEPKPIIGWVEKDPTTNWLNVKIEGPGTKNGFIGITCTPRHKFLTNHGWKFAKDLDINIDKLISKYSSMYNGTLKSFLNGIAIGDSSIRLRKINTARLLLRDNLNLEYIQWKVEMLSKAFSFKVGKIPRKTSNSNISYYYTSEYSVELAQLSKSIHRDPLEVFSKGLDWLSFSLWYMDDGHLSKGRQITISCPVFRTNTHELLRLFKSYGLTCKRSLNNLRFDRESSKRIIENIHTYIHPSMYYKLPSEYQGKFRPYTLEYTKEVLPIECSILSIKEAGSRNCRKPYKYDLTIEGNHNFLAGNVDNGIIVHNTTPGGKALAFYASIRIGLYGGKQITKKIKGKERKIGRVTSIRTIKNKVATPGPTLKGSPLYNNAKYVDSIGFDRLHFLDEILIEEEIIEKTKSGTYSYKGKTLCRGAEKFADLLREDDDLRRKLIRKAGINTLGATKKLLESLNENLYPIDGINSDEYEDDEQDESDE